MAASLCSVTTEEEVRIRMEVQNLQGPVAMPRALLTAHEQSRDPTERPKLALQRCSACGPSGYHSSETRCAFVLGFPTPKALGSTEPGCGAGDA